MTGTVAQFVRILNRLAPPRLAESWDPVGLQLGSPNWPVNKIWTALDPLLDVVADACANDVDLLVTHHPLFFKPLKSIDGESALGRIISMALSRRLAIFSAHTNLDSAAGGVNDVLAGRIGLNHLRVLASPGQADRFKLVVFVPSDHVKRIIDTLFELDAGRIGNYSCCTFRCEGVGTFSPETGATPAIGEHGTINEVQESRIEVLLSNDKLDGVVDALKAAHPYETMAYDVYPLSAQDQRTGLGRVGELAAPMSLAAFCTTLKKVLNLSTVKVVGNPERTISTVAVCSGSGSSLLAAAVASGAQVYVSGDLGYHVARDAQQADIGLVDVGHFASEHLVVGALASSIREAVAASGLSATVEAAGTESDPFQYI